MAGANQHTRTLDQVIVIANSISGIGNTRTYQGYKRFADATNFEANVAALASGTQGYFWAGLKKIAAKENDVRSFSIIGELCVSVPKDVSDDMNAAWDLAISLTRALSLSSNFNNIAIPGEISCSLHDMKTIQTAGIAYFDFGRYGDGGISFLDP